MEFEDSLANSRWKILLAVSQGAVTAAEIAKRTKTSLPNVSQQVRLLEAYGFLKRTQRPNEGGGKPRNEYAITKSIGFVATLRDGYAAKRTLALDDFHSSILNVWFYPKQEEHYYLQKFYWENEELISECDAIAVTDANPKELHLLVVAQHAKLERLRKRFSKITVTSLSKEQKDIICWTHSVEEIREGVGKKEEYFLNLLRKPHVIIDKDGAWGEVTGGGQ